MPELSITLQPDQEVALRSEYGRFCVLLTNAVSSAPAPSFEQYLVAKLTGNTTEVADEMVRSIITSGAYNYLDRWLKGRFSSFVMTLLRKLRPAGYGFVRGKETSDEALAKGAAWLLDCLETEFGTPIPQEAREEILQDMPRSAFFVDTLFPNESIGRLFDAANSYLRDCYVQCSEAHDQRGLEKGEQLIAFLSGFPEWKGIDGGEWSHRFQNAREVFQMQRESRMSWLDRLLKKVVEHREGALSQ